MLAGYKKKNSWKNNLTVFIIAIRNDIIIPVTYLKSCI